jgi:hypothetical protein
MYAMLLSPVPQEINLEVKRPGPHVSVEIGQIGIIGHRFVRRLPAQPGRQAIRQARLAGPDVAGHQQKTLGHRSSLPIQTSKVLETLESAQHSL